MGRSITVLLYNYKQLRGFIESDFFYDISLHHQVNYLLTENLLGQRLLDNNTVKFIPNFPKIAQASGNLINGAILWKHRRRAISYFFRANSIFGFRKLRSESTYYIDISKNKVNNMNRLIVRLLAISPIMKALLLVRKFYVHIFLRVHLKQNKISLEKLDLILVPYSGLSTMDFDDYINFFKKIKKTTIAIQDNWDSLSSKTFIMSNPDYFCVWGEQSLGHLQSFHRLRGTKVRLIGSPRMAPYNSSNTKFDIYKKISDELVLNLKSDFILFAGTGDGLEDDYILDVITKSITGGGKISIIYKPHPYTRHKLTEPTINNLKLKGVVVLDSESSKFVFYHCSLVLNAKLVITQFSTIIVESLLCDVKTLIPTFVRAKVKFDWSYAINTVPYLLGIVAFPNIYVSKNYETFKKDLYLALEAPNFSSQNAANWLCSKIDSSSALLEIIDSI